MHTVTPWCCAIVRMCVMPLCLLSHTIGHKTSLQICAVQYSSPPRAAWPRACVKLLSVTPVILVPVRRARERRRACADAAMAIARQLSALRRFAVGGLITWLIGAAILGHRATADVHHTTKTVTCGGGHSSVRGLDVLDLPPSPPSGPCYSCEESTWPPQRITTPARCSLSLSSLLELTSNGDYRDAVSIEGGHHLRVRSKSEPWRSCSGYELLAQVITEHTRHDSTASMCEVQHELQQVASQLGASLSTSPGTFSLLQDCTTPPCCPHKLSSFASAHPRATVLTDTGPAANSSTPLPDNLWTLAPASSAGAINRRRRAARACGGGCVTLQIAHGLQGHPLLPLLGGAPQAATAAAAALVRHDAPVDSTADAHAHASVPAVDAAADAHVTINAVDAALAAEESAEDGGAAATIAAAGGVQHEADGSVHRRGRTLQSVPIDDALARAQEEAAETLLESVAVGDGDRRPAERAREGGATPQRHSALLRVARKASGGRVVAAASGRSVGGPAATASARDAAEAHAAAARSHQVDPFEETPQHLQPRMPPQFDHSSKGAERSRQPSRASSSHTSIHEGMGTREDATAHRLEQPESTNPRTLSEGDGSVEGDGGSASADVVAEHLMALGHLLRSARRTLLLLPAAEAMTAALDAAESRGLPRALSSQLRSLLPYITAREAERLLIDAATAADGAPPGSATAPPLQTLRVAGAAQKAAHARGYVLVLVLNDEPPRGVSAAESRARACPKQPLGRGCVAAATATIAGGLLLSRALALQLDRRAICRLRSGLARAPLSVDMRENAQRWRLLGASIVAVPTLEATAAAGADGDGGADGASTALDDYLPAAADVLRALALGEAELRRRNLCASATSPIVLTGPDGAARRVGACATVSATAERGQCASLALRPSATQPPTVMCADGVCRATFVHCFRALAAAAADSSDVGAFGEGDLLATALPACATAERRSRLEAALPHAAALLSALATYHAADRALFAGVCR